MQRSIPAFPKPVKNIHEQEQTGMDLRDFFAALAMQGIITMDLTLEKIAKLAYEMADHMLIQRNKNEKQ